MPTEHKIAYRSSDRKAPPRSFEVLQESGWYNPPVTGTYTIVCIGAGGGGAGSFTLDKHLQPGQSGARGVRVEMEIFLHKGEAVPYIIGLGGKGGKCAINEYVSHPDHSGSNGGTTVFDNQVSADGGHGGICGCEGDPSRYWYIDGSYVNDDGVDKRLWYGDGGTGAALGRDGYSGRNGCIVVIHPAEPIEN